MRFVGKVYQAKRSRGPKNADWTLEDLRALPSLRGTPIWLEHASETGAVGEITNHWVDIDNWLVIEGELYPAERIGRELHARVSSDLRSKTLRDLSIHWVGRADNRSGVVDLKTRRLVEVSLTTRGAFEGTTLLSVAASRQKQLGGDQQLQHYIMEQSGGEVQSVNSTPAEGVAMDFDVSAAERLAGEAIDPQLAADPRFQKFFSSINDRVSALQAQHGQYSKIMEAATNKIIQEATPEIEAIGEVLKGNGVGEVELSRYTSTLKEWVGDLSGPGAGNWRLTSTLSKQIAAERQAKEAALAEKKKTASLLTSVQKELATLKGQPALNAAAAAGSHEVSVAANASSGGALKRAAPSAPPVAKRIEMPASLLNLPPQAEMRYITEVQKVLQQGGAV